ncbi:prenyltransferase/squalene oxidase repeat-containing protein [Methanocella arvoryzae]|uniref:Squalene cyclase C-terminal domain-containing protein n=1 Tax=Methanocella arvoryzae (strain DSM 22066 / NBRC 105507 / MRE50) TaxID=351160 RepID=Q0W133_METAR|nr:prenyltransferase/squalene oxidase repeat-containing protein [Methanocella arvoryzae]CAJ37910.1 hypothetical protein RRC149 [Methanocella arvoryzae MRE50]
MSQTVDLAVRYLTQAQNSDGSWGSGDPMVSARAIYALKDCEGSEAVIERGIAYLESCQQPDGHFPPKTQMYTDAATTAYALVALNQYSYSKASKLVSRGLIWLMEHQQPDGSWSGHNTNKNAYTTSLCLRALYTFYLTGISRYRKGVTHVMEKMAEPGFFDEPVSHVYAPVLNMHRIGYLMPEVREAFVNYATEHIDLSMKAGKIVDVAYLCGTLAALDEEDMARQCADYLAGARNSDGGYGKETGQASDPNWTALVMLALENRL